MTVLKCKKCGAEVTQKDLDYAEENDHYPTELEHQADCGCYEEDEGLMIIAIECTHLYIG